MMRHAICAGAVLLFFTSWQVLLAADIDAEFKRLEKTFERQVDDEEYDAALKTALTLYRLADEADYDQLQYKSSAAFKLGVVYNNMRRYEKAEQFYEWSLAVGKKLYGSRSYEVAANLNNLAVLYEKQEQFEKAESMYKAALSIWKDVVKPGSRRIAQSLGNLGDLYAELGRYAEAEPLLRQALAMNERIFGSESLEVAGNLCFLGNLYTSMGRHSQALHYHERELDIHRKKLPPQHPDIQRSLCNLAVVYGDLGRYAEAEKMKKEALAMAEAIWGPVHPNVATDVNNLATLYDNLARFGEAEALYYRAVAIREKVFPGDHTDKAQTFNNLGIHFSDQAQYGEAEKWYRRSIEMLQRIYPDEHPDIASSLNGLANVFLDQGRLSKAEEMHRQVLEMRKRLLRPDHPQISGSLGNLALVYTNQGRYAEAEVLTKESLLIDAKNFGWEHIRIATGLNNWGNLSMNQNRAGEAEYLHKKALEIKEKHFEPEHPDVARSLNNLGIACKNQLRYEEAVDYHQRALAMREKLLPRDHPEIAQSIENLAVVYEEQNRHKEAEEHYLRSLAIKEKLYGPDHSFVARTLNNLGWLYEAQGRDADAERVAERAIGIYEHHATKPGDQVRVHNLRAQLTWKSGQREEALSDLQLAIKYAEQQRALSSGRESDRAGVLSSFDVFERMADWQAQMGNLSETFAAIERGRARSLWDQIATRAMDPLASIPKEKAREFRRRQQEAEDQIARLTTELQALNEKEDLAEGEYEKQRAEMQRQLAWVRYQYVSVYADIRSSSEAYRLAIAEGRECVSLEDLTEWVNGQNGLLLEYYLGAKRSFVLVISANGKPILHRLTITQHQADFLGVEAGPLTAKLLQKILNSENGTSILEGLRGSRDQDMEREISKRLAALWDILLPATERESLTGGKYQHLIVIPDGCLARLPFETLVVETSGNPKYLLDVGPPIQYAPSATILINLAARQEQTELKGREPVLTVGNPYYGSTNSDEKPTLLAQLSPGSRYARVGGTFKPLFYSGWETDWVKEVFGEAGQTSIQLQSHEATEANVCSQLPGRRVVHLACHGLVDESYGNLFGALVLTPGKQDNMADDGFLTLAEIYRLNLKGCELAILSACDTNVGPTQRGEGVWALSRGFLVAGSRRVVASNWLVDDEAAPNFVSYFSSIIAKAEHEGKKPDYAEAVYRAKLFLRHHKNKKWNNPYYWGTFVLIGPN